MAYSYEPDKIGENDVYRMRLELGDTTFAPAELTAALCDEEYRYIIDSSQGKWKQAKVECLKAILMKYSHQVNTKIDDLSYSFSDRVKVWREMLDELEQKSTGAIPAMNAAAMKSPHYFYNDMHKNPEST